MVYLLEDGRQCVDKSIIEDGEKYIEIQNFIDPIEEDGFVVYVVGIEDSKPKYAKKPIVVPEPVLTTKEKILSVVGKSQDEVRQEGADLLMEELMKRGVLK